MTETIQLTPEGKEAYYDFLRAKSLLERRKMEVTEKYGSNYVAVGGDFGVIDYDADELRLVRRMDERTITDERIIIGTLDDFFVSGARPDLRTTKVWVLGRKE